MNDYDSGRLSAFGVASVSCEDSPPFLDPSAFRHLGVSIRRDEATGGQIATHVIEILSLPLGASTFDRFIARFDHPDLPVNAGQFDCVIHIDGRKWQPGQQIALELAFRLPAGIYNTSVGVFDSQQKHRFNWQTGKEHLLASGPADVTLAPNPTLQAPPPLQPANMGSLLPDILGMQPIAANNVENLTFCFGQAPSFGHILEFGVGPGRSTIRSCSRPALTSSDRRWSAPNRLRPRMSNSC